MGIETEAFKDLIQQRFILTPDTNRTKELLAVVGFGLLLEAFPEGRDRLNPNLTQPDPLPATVMPSNDLISYLVIRVMAGSGERSPPLGVLFIKDGIMTLDSRLELNIVDAGGTEPEGGDSGVDSPEQVGVEIVLTFSTGDKILKMEIALMDDSRTELRIDLFGGKMSRIGQLFSEPLQSLTDESSRSESRDLKGSPYKRVEVGKS